MKDSVCHKECMTIVVPVFNRPGLIERCLDSLRSQTYRPLHVIVVDNASTDDTFAHVKEWIALNQSEGLSVELLSEPTPGAANARQTGLQHTLTDKVMFFDSDDTLRSGCVASVMHSWDISPESDIIAWPVTIHLDGAVRKTHSIQGSLIDRHLVHSILRTQGYAVKTEFIKKAGGWKGEFSCWDDLELGMRLLMSDPKLTALSDVFVDVYHQSESITGDSFSEKAGGWETALDGIERAIRDSGRKDSRHLLNVVNYRRAILAADYAKEKHLELAMPLYQQALSATPKEKRPLIRFAYHWTKLGLRGAFSIVGKFL